MIASIIFWLYFAFIVCALVVTSTLLSICYRRTANKGFLWLLVALVVWPCVEAGLNQVADYFIGQTYDGIRPWLFPYSLMGSDWGRIFTFDI